MCILNTIVILRILVRAVARLLCLALQGVVVCVCVYPIPPGAWWQCGWLMCTGLIPCGRLIVSSISLFLSPWLTSAVTNRPAGQREASLGGEEGWRRVRQKEVMALPIVLLPIVLLPLPCFPSWWQSAVSDSPAWCVSVRSEAVVLPKAFLSAPLSLSSFCRSVIFLNKCS